MTRRRFTVLLIVALAAISCAWYLSGRRNPQRDPQGLPLLPSLATDVNTVSSLSVIKGSATPTVTVHKQGDRWTVAERADYPADVAKLRNLILALNAARIREEKTADPASFSLIGVEDPSLPGASGAQVELVAAHGKLAVIVGKAVGNGNFVRRGGENTSYSVEPGISIETDPRFWIDTRLLDLPISKIQGIESKPSSGPAFAVHRVPAAGSKPQTPVSDSFALQGVPNGRQAADPQTLAPSATSFSALTVEDVAPVGDIDFNMASTVTVTGSDGDILTITGAAIGNKRWIKLTSTKDAALNAKAAGRAFEITSYRYDAIFRPLEQLLVPKAPSTAQKPAAATKPSRSAPRP